MLWELGGKALNFISDKGSGTLQRGGDIWTCTIKEKEVALGQSEDKTCQVASLGAEMGDFRCGDWKEV